MGGGILQAVIRPAPDVGATELEPYAPLSGNARACIATSGSKCRFFEQICFCRAKVSRTGRLCYSVTLYAACAVQNAPLIRVTQGFIACSCSGSMMPWVQQPTSPKGQLPSIAITARDKKNHSRRVNISQHRQQSIRKIKPPGGLPRCHNASHM